MSTQSITPILAVVAIVFIFRRPIMLLVWLYATRWGLADIGARSIQQQPDRVHLIRRDRSAWKQEAAYNDFAPLLAEGFEDAGTYGIDPLPDVMARFFVNPETKTYAVIYDHPKAGVWLNFVALYTNGDSSTYSNTPARGLNPRPGHEVVNEPGATAQELYKMFLARRPDGWMRSVDREAVIASFEKAYAEGMAWRKRQGVSVEEVLRVARTRLKN
jgi:hypothetical protein